MSILFADWINIKITFLLVNTCKPLSSGLSAKLNQESNLSISLLKSILIISFANNPLKMSFNRCF